nr:uncharacterized mitochondrial protein AtMg00810-like [Tanacetum cinerariifolium]
MFAVCACARFQVTPKVSHLNAVKGIFRYLKEKPYMGLWYPKDSPFDLVAYSDSDYAGCSLRNMVIEIVVLNNLSDALPITTNGVNTPRSDEDRLKLMKLMVFLLQKGETIAEDVTDDVANEAIPSTLFHSFYHHHHLMTFHLLLKYNLHLLNNHKVHLKLHHRKLEIIKLKARVKRLERANKVKSYKLRRLKKVRTSQRVVSSDDMKDVFNQGRMIDDLDKDEGIELVVDQVKDADTTKIEGRHAAEQAEK